MPICLIINGSQTEQCKQFTGCVLHHKSDPIILKRWKFSWDQALAELWCVQKLVWSTAHLQENFWEKQRPILPPLEVQEADRKLTLLLILLLLTTTALQLVQRNVQLSFKVIFSIQQRFSPPQFKKAAVVSTGTLCKNKTFDKWMEKNTLWSAEYTDIHKCRGHWRNA